VLPADAARFFIFVRTMINSPKIFYRKRHNKKEPSRKAIPLRLGKS